LLTQDDGQLKNVTCLELGGRFWAKTGGVLVGVLFSCYTVVIIDD